MHVRLIPPMALLIATAACNDGFAPPSSPTPGRPGGLSANRQELVDLCHVDQYGNTKVVSIPLNATKGHFDHGDAWRVLPIPPTAVMTASNTMSGSNTRNAFDSDFFTVWNSGLYQPQWIEIDFGAPQRFAIIAATTDQTPDGSTAHAVTIDGVFSFAWTGYTVDKQVPEHTFGSMIDAQRVRVSTTSSPSWVSWYEIQFRGC